ncbi:MAG: alpha/beta hydrolase [Deltaproteobacteria bacterium]|nr:alpha/beta hydrolase [Deltaproteobacteria bacterium]
MALRTTVHIAVTASIVTIVGFGAVAAGRISGAADASAANPAVRDAAAGTPVQLKTADGLTLGAHLYGGGDTGVILAHQYNGDQTGWTDFAIILAAHGYCALTFDFRGFPESGLIVHVPSSPVDLKAAYDFMRPRVKHLFVAGASMGADAALALASRYPVTGLILLSTPVEFGGLNVYDADAEVKAPMLFVETTDDPFVAGNSAVLYQHANATKSLKIYSGHEHGTEILRGPHGAELRNLMLQFIADRSH